MSQTRTARMPQPLPIVSLALRNEADVVLVRQRARLIAELLGFSHVDQTRVATAVSEIARNAIQHAGGGRVRCALSGDVPRRLLISVEDSGADGSRLQPREGARELGRGGLGVELARRLMDQFESHSREQGGTVVEMSRRLPPQRQAMGADDVRALVDELLRRPPESLIEELQHQHQELLAVLENLTTQQESLRQVNTELEETNRGVMALYAQVAQELDDTNRGVMALYAQLDDQARELQHVNILKDQFISHLSHEFRTPLNSTLALSRLLLDEADGPLSHEQERQVRFIYDGAGELLGMVNDLLDLAKIEAGRLDVNPETFSVEDLFSTLRGMLRPLAVEKGIELIFREPSERIPPLRTDQHKATQILRNLIANAVKFTEEGEVRIGASLDDAETIVFEVQDTGIGIPADQIERVFGEFEQVASVQQRRTAGTGLGLPLSRKLAALLGGSIEAESRLGEGSTFRFRVPCILSVGEDGAPAPLRHPAAAPASVSSPIDLGRTPRSPGEDAAGPRARGR